MRNVIPAFLFLCACGGAIVDAPSPDMQPRSEFDVPGALVVETLAATELWTSAGYQVPAVVIGAQRPEWKLQLWQGLIEGCADAGKGALGCTETPVLRGDRTLIRISTQVADEELVSVLAHEIGHALGLSHAAGDVMDPDRDLAGEVCLPGGPCWEK